MILDILENTNIHKNVNKLITIDCIENQCKNSFEIPFFNQLGIMSENINAATCCDDQDVDILSLISHG